MTRHVKQFDLGDGLCVVSGLRKTTYIGTHLRFHCVAMPGCLTKLIDWMLASSDRQSHHRSHKCLDGCCWPQRYRLLRDLILESLEKALLDHPTPDRNTTSSYWKLYHLQGFCCSCCHHVFQELLRGSHRNRIQNLRREAMYQRQSYQ